MPMAAAIPAVIGMLGVGAQMYNASEQRSQQDKQMKMQNQQYQQSMANNPLVAQPTPATTQPPTGQPQLQTTTMHRRPDGLISAMATSHRPCPSPSTPDNPPARTPSGPTSRRPAARRATLRLRRETARARGTASPVVGRRPPPADPPAAAARFAGTRSAGWRGGRPVLGALRPRRSGNFTIGPRKAGLRPAFTPSTGA